MLRKTFVLPVFLLFLVFLGTSLQALKAPWVDECYTIYGITHDSILDFFPSITSGINFSPPLYFLINSLINIFWPLSIELLRIQSLFWTIFGLTLSYFFLKRCFGSAASILGILLFASQSELLFNQSLEARHYTMFFALGALVLLHQQNFLSSNKKTNFDVFGFASHFLICLVHYFGIIFSGLTVLSLLFFHSKKSLKERIPFSIFFSWVLAVPIYVVLLRQQSSHLGNWPRPNGIHDLLESYNSSIILISLVVPIFLFLCFKKSKAEPLLAGGQLKLAQKVIIGTSVLWFCVPLLFWSISHFYQLNLFKDRYFIPKEVTSMVFVSLILYFCLKRIRIINHFSSLHLTIWGTFAFSSVLILIGFKRSTFGMQPERNYHHWLLIDDEIRNLDIPLVFTDDPLYFPNAYLFPKNCYFFIDEENLRETYISFSSLIKCIEMGQLEKFSSFILVSPINEDTIDLCYYEIN